MIPFSAIIILTVIVVAFVALATPSAPPVSRFAPGAAFGAAIVTATLASPLPAACGPAVPGYGTSYWTSYFNGNPAFLTPISFGDSSGQLCTEIAMLDTGWWPTAAFAVDLLWNRAKDGSPTSLADVATPLGTYAAPILDVSGKNSSYATTIYAIPALNLWALDGSLQTFGTARQQLLPLTSGAQSYTGPLAMTGELDGAQPMTVGGVYPRAMVTYSAVANYALVLAYSSSQLGLTPVASAADISAAYRMSGISAPLYTTPDSLSPAWGFFVYLTVATVTGSAAGWFLVDTGAIGVTMIVSSAFASQLACYSPMQTTLATSAAGSSCYALQRACVSVFGAAAPMCFPVMVGPDIAKAPAAAGRIGMAFMQYVDVFTAHAGGTIASAVQIAAGANWSALECSQLSSSMTGATCAAPGSACPATVPISSLGCAA